MEGRLYVPYDQPFDPVIPWPCHGEVGEEYYLPLQDYLELTGLSLLLKPKENSTSIVQWPTWARSPWAKLFCLKMNFICVKAEGLLT